MRVGIFGYILRKKELLWHSMVLWRKRNFGEMRRPFRWYVVMCEVSGDRGYTKVRSIAIRGLLFREMYF